VIYAVQHDPLVGNRIHAIHISIMKMEESDWDGRSNEFKISSTNTFT